MSTNRITPSAGWIHSSRLQKGPNGRSLCRWCSQEVPKGRRSFCSDECVHQHKLRSDPGYLRDQVFKRDQGICAVCRIDCEMVTRVHRRLVAKAQRASVRYERYEPLARFQRKFPRFCWGKSYWAADHIVPVAEGGGECGLENIRTLCLGCHADATRRLHERLKYRRRLQAGQPGLFGMED